MGEQAPEHWSTGAAYERYVGRWSRPVAHEFLSWLAVPDGRVWTDVGCGTGALTGRVLSRCAPQGVTGVDRSEGFLAEARRQWPDARVRFQPGDATALPLDAATSDATVSGLTLNFVPDHAAVVREMVRVTRPGGKVAAYVWDYAGGMAMKRHFWDAAVAVTPQAAALDEARRFPVCQPEPLAALWQHVGLTAVSVRAIDIPTVFQDFADYWTPFLGQQGPAPSHLASLDPSAQEQIREHLRARLASVPDGPIALTARAWAVQGIVP